MMATECAFLRQLRQTDQEFSERLAVRRKEHKVMNQKFGELRRVSVNVTREIMLHSTKPCKADDTFYMKARSRTFDALDAPVRSENSSGTTNIGPFILKKQKYVARCSTSASPTGSRSSPPRSLLPRLQK